MLSFVRTARAQKKESMDVYQPHSQDSDSAFVVNRVIRMHNNLICSNDFIGSN